MSAPGHLALLAWLSPSFPIGAFAYSHGLETAVSDGDVRDGATLQAWVLDLLRHGSIRTDLILAACVARALAAGDEDRFREAVRARHRAFALQGAAPRDDAARPILHGCAQRRLAVTEDR